MNLAPRVCDLSGALTRMGGDRQLLGQIVEFFREDYPRYLARLRAAVESGDPAEVKHAAHSLHGLVANFGAEMAAGAALRLEEMGHAGDLSAAAVAERTLRDEIIRLEQALLRESGDP